MQDLLPSVLYFLQKKVKKYLNKGEKMTKFYGYSES